MSYRQDEEAGPTWAGTPPSQQVSWHEVYLYAERLAAHHGTPLNHYPMPGTPAWCGMPDDDARKLLSLILGGVRDALRNDTRQEAAAEASKSIADSADWPAVARTIRRRSSVYIPRRTA